MITERWQLNKTFRGCGQIQSDSLFEKLGIEMDEFDKWVIHIPSLNVTFLDNEEEVHFGPKVFHEYNTISRILYFQSFFSKLDKYRKQQLLQNNEIYFESFPNYKFVNIYFLPADSSLIGNTQTPISESISEYQSGDYSVPDTYSRVKVRAKQSKWRKEILNNYGNLCYLPTCDVNDPKLLTASHIKDYRFAENKQLPHRAHPQNGLCFCYLCHKLFDSGYFTLTDNYEIEISSNKQITSKIVSNLLNNSVGQQIPNLPQKGLEPLLDFINHHRKIWKF